VTAVEPDQARRAEYARLRWRCRRGMRELDAVLAGFLEQAFADLPSAELGRLAAILDLPDPELYAYLVGKREPADPRFADLFERIRASVRPAT